MHLKEHIQHYYDQRARPRELNVEDEVLVRLPTNNNKLLMHWKGPYKMIEKIGMNDYRVRGVKGKVRTYHVNLLKEYVERKEEESMKGKLVMELVGAGVIESEEGEYGGVIDEDQLLDVGQVQSAETCKDVKVSEELSKKQRSEVYKILH